jgi:hypothetical protein
VALFNNGYPASYPQYFPQYQPFSAVPAQNNSQSQQNGIIWVSGEAGAKAYLVAPNTTVQLWDSEAQTIYLKSADASGMPSMKVLDYTIRDSHKTAPVTQSGASDGSLSIFATKDEIRVVTDQITALRERIDNLSKREKEEDEK